MPPRAPTSRTAKLCLAALLLPACHAAPLQPPSQIHRPAQDTEAAVAEPGHPAGSPGPRTRQMHDWLDAAANMRDAVVNGDLDEANVSLASLRSRRRSIQTSGESISRLDALLRESSVDPYASIEDAAASVGRLAVACGNCHIASGAKLQFPQRDPIVLDGSLESAMRAHALSVSQMWEGLVGPDGDRWRQGTSTFLAPPGCNNPDIEASSELTRLCRKAARLIRRGHLAEETATRRQIYSRLLETCASCHRATRTSVSGRARDAVLQPAAEGTVLAAGWSDA